MSKRPSDCSLPPAKSIATTAPSPLAREKALLRSRMPPLEWDSYMSLPAKDIRDMITELVMFDYCTMCNTRKQRTEMAFRACTGGRALCTTCVQRTVQWQMLACYSFGWSADVWDGIVASTRLSHLRDVAPCAPYRYMDNICNLLWIYVTRLVCEGCERTHSREENYLDAAVHTKSVRRLDGHMLCTQCVLKCGACATPALKDECYYIVNTLRKCAIEYLCTTCRPNASPDCINTGEPCVYCTLPVHRGTKATSLSAHFTKHLRVYAHAECVKWCDRCTDFTDRAYDKAALQQGTTLCLRCANKCKRCNSLLRAKTRRVRNGELYCIYCVGTTM